MTPSISAFFPAYNDAATIGSLVRAADETLRGLSPDYEIIVVDDGSRDDTLQVLTDLQAPYPSLRIVKHARNRGYGAALRTGFASCRHDLVCYTDGDGQYDPREFRLLVEQICDEIDVIQGYKIRRHDPLHRIVLGRLYHWLVKTAFRLHVRDVDCDFRLIRRTALERLRLTQDSGVICVELMTLLERNGFHIHEVPVHHYRRAFGRSEFFRPRHLLRVGRDLMLLWVRLILVAPARDASLSLAARKT